MQKIWIIVVCAVMLAACNRQDALEIPAGSDVAVQMRDGASIEGRLVEVKHNEIVVETRDGKKTRLARAQIASLRGAPKAPLPVAAGDGPTAPTSGAAPNAPVTESASPLTKVLDRGPEYREVTLPIGTLLPLELATTVASNSSNVEDPVRATLRRAVTVDGVEAMPAGTTVLGHVTQAERAGRVKGRARIAFRFSQIDLPGGGGRHAIRTGTIAREAPGTKKQDAAKIGGGAAGGAIIGGLIGGGDGAAKGAAIGGGAGTAVVMSTRGKEVSLASGTALSVKLAAPLTLRVAVSKR